MDRKARIREYKETSRPMGVYRIRNRTNGKSFVGSSVDLPAILNRHRAQLKMGSHPNRALQNDWQALGPEAFDFESLDTLKPPDAPGYDPSEDLRTLEALWIEKLAAFGEHGYHGTPRPSAPAPPKRS